MRTAILVNLDKKIMEREEELIELRNLKKQILQIGDNNATSEKKVEI